MAPVLRAIVIFSVKECFYDLSVVPPRIDLVDCYSRSCAEPCCRPPFRWAGECGPCVRIVDACDVSLSRVRISQPPMLRQGKTWLFVHPNLQQRVIGRRLLDYENPAAELYLVSARIGRVKHARGLANRMWAHETSSRGYGKVCIAMDGFLLSLCIIPFVRASWPDVAALLVALRHPIDRLALNPKHQSRKPLVAMHSALYKRSLLSLCSVSFRLPSYITHQEQQFIHTYLPHSTNQPDSNHVLCPERLWEYAHPPW